jgi:hypothetical protein
MLSVLHIFYKIKISKIEAFVGYFFRGIATNKTKAVGSFPRGWPAYSRTLQSA